LFDTAQTFGGIEQQGDLLAASVTADEPRSGAGLAGTRYRPIVGTKAERRAARERVSAYHQARLAELLSHVGAAIDRYRVGEIDAYVVDETIHHCHRAAAELWKCCFARGGGAHAEFVADLLDSMTAGTETTDWWERATPQRHQ
jgi:hypothetical protein